MFFFRTELLAWYAVKEASAFQEANYEYLFNKQKHGTEQILPLDSAVLRI